MAATAIGMVASETIGRKSLPRAPGRLVGLQGRKVHLLERRGEGPTVVLESGLGNPVTMWSWLLGLLPEEVPYLAYDRPGIGWSEASHAQVDSESYPDRLMAILRRARARAPFVLVGHSVGGLLIRQFAERYPEYTVGMVFVDSTHPDQFKRSPGQTDGLLVLQNWLDRQIVRSALRLPADEALFQEMRGLPQHLSRPTCEVFYRSSALRAARRELRLAQGDWATAAARLTSVDCPVAVLSAEQTLARDSINADLHRELAELSPRQQSEIVAEADHTSLLSRPQHADRVGKAIQWVIAMAGSAESMSNAQPA